MLCKDCITLAICRGRILNLLSEWYKYSSDCKRYKYIDVYIVYSQEVKCKCNLIEKNYWKHSTKVDTKKFVSYLINQLSLGEINVV